MQDPPRGRESMILLRLPQNFLFNNLRDGERAERTEQEALLVEREEIDAGPGIHNGALTHEDPCSSSKPLRSVSTSGKAPISTSTGSR